MQVWASSRWMEEEDGRKLDEEVLCCSLAQYLTWDDMVLFQLLMLLED